MRTSILRDCRRDAIRASDEQRREKGHGIDPDGAGVSTRVVLIDDSSVCADVLMRILGKIPDRTFRVTHCATADEGLHALAGAPDVLLFLDHDIGGDSGLDLLREIRSRGDQRPVIVLSGHRQRSVRQAYIGAGADSYLCKDALDAPRLVRSLLKASRRHQDRI